MNPTDPPPGAPDGPPPAAPIDAVTGEVREDLAPPEPGTGRAAGAGVAGERGIPSVNRERSLQSRLSNLLALGTIVLLGGGFLLWYYTTAWAQARHARDAQSRAAESRVAGELKLAPLDRVDPPVVRVAAGLVTAPPEPTGLVAPPPAASAPAPTKTPAQLELERQLGEPVLKRGRGAGASPAGAAAATATADPSADGVGQGAVPQVNPTVTAAGLAGGPTLLASRLQPTPTPAVQAQVLPTRRFLLPKSAFVDCTLETAIDSTFDGLVTCIGASDIYSADGQVVLLERGTKYVGEKRGDVRQGQARVFVLWHEARTPTGVVARLDSPGTDELGRTGLPGQVDTHFWDRFGAALLISVIDGTLQVLAARESSAGGDRTTVQINPGGARDVMTEVLKNTIAIPPTVIKPQGDRIQILVARDVDFRAVYALRDTAPAPAGPAN